MLRPIGTYLERLDSAYKDQNQFIRLKARLLTGLNALLIALVLVNLLRFFWTQPPALPIRICLNLFIAAAIAASLRKALKGHLEAAGSYLALGLVIPVHLIIAIVPANYFQQPLGSAFQLLIFDTFLLILSLIFSSKRTAIACFLMIALGNGILYFKALATDPIQGTMRFAADTVARDGLLALSFIFAIGVLLIQMLEAVTKRSEQMLQSIKSMNADLEDRVRERTKELEEATKAANKATLAKGEFLATMSHEIRTPLHGIIAQTELLKEQTEQLSENAQNELNIISESGDLLLSLINDILDFSKIEAQQLQLAAYHFSPNQIMEESIATVASSAAKNGIEIQFERTESPPLTLLGDSFRLKQIFLNLLSNAIKFTPPGGEVTAFIQVRKIEKGAAHLYFRVTDTGIGMDAPTIQLIFDRFTQADSSTTRQYGGTGLGLAISSRLVAMMGGQLHVESELGKGARFEFELTFPVVDSQQLPPEPTISSFDPLGLHVLVVEDNGFNRKIIRKQLDKLGCTYTTATNGKEALDVLKSSRDIQLILMDSNMPVMDGKQATKIIREWKLAEDANPLQRAAAELPIIAFTANVINKVDFANEYPGMDDFLIKPLRMQRLYDLLKRYCLKE